jgi:hypothetical protein
MTRSEAFAFVAGGTVQAGGGVYLERQADLELRERCRAGDFTYILTSRQMGKSSLMIRTAERMAGENILPVIVDLTEFGAQATAEQWYKGFLYAVQDQLGLQTSASDWWEGQSEHHYVQRFTRYLQEVALTERTERLVIFVDEIDTTLRLDFTDDFFAAIRLLYQKRAVDPQLKRLSFVLIGVATPGDLIKDAARTPFNIGHRIELTDFTLDEASQLALHLPLPESIGRELIGWVLRWTGGHPYLTLRVIRSLAESPPPDWTSAAVDDRVRVLFLKEGAETDSNLQFVRDMLTKKAFDREAVLGMYGRIRGGERVRDKELDQVTSWLKLSGVVCRRGGLLRVRNAIYEHVFDERWTRDHLRLNVNWRRRLVKVATVLLILIVLVTIPLAIFAWRLKTEAEYQARRAEFERDEATRHRVIAETSLSESIAALERARKLLEGLERPTAAAPAAAPEVATEHEAARKELEDLSSKLRAEREDTRNTAAAAGQASPPRADINLRPTEPAAAGRGSASPRQLPIDADRTAIRRVLDQYGAAYASKNVDALRRVQALTPLDVKNITAQFREIRDYRVTIDKEDINIAPDGRQATVTAHVARLFTSGGRLTRNSGVEVFTLQKRSGNWIVVAVKP